MKILYLSCHSILEHDETKLFTQMGHQVLSLGAYQKPDAPQDVKRPGYEGFYDDHLQAVAIQCSKENLHQELIDWADVIMIMHRPDWVLANWLRIKHKRVVWRSIGQSTSDIESQLTIPRMEGLQIVRYSPMEKNIPGFVGEDAMIRFYKDQAEFGSWTGEKEEVITVAQSMQKRGSFCGFDIFNEVTKTFPRKLFGPDNEDSGIPGGLLDFKGLLGAYRTSRAYFYTGTYPASYTLNFMEAFMTGIPIVAIGKTLANLNIWPMETYEIPNFIEHGVDGFISDDLEVLRQCVEVLLKNPEEAARIGRAGRRKAIELFGIDRITEEWRKFL